METKEIMVTDINTVSADMNVKEALRLLFKLKISGLPVVDNDYKLIGMFTEESVLSRIFPSHTKGVGEFIYEEGSQIIQKRLTQMQDLRVNDVMIKDMITAGENSPFSELVRLMLTKEVRRIPIVDTDNKLVGIVARGDILRALIKG